MVVCLERDADLHVAQLMPLPLTVSCFSKIRLVLPFWYRLTRVVLEKRPLNVCVCLSRCVPETTLVTVPSDPLTNLRNNKPEDFPMYTHTHTRLTALCPGLPRVSWYQKGKPIWILLKQETASGSGISRAIRKSAPRSRQITTPVPQHSIFLQTGCPSCRPTNSVKALKASYVYSVY